MMRIFICRFFIGIVGMLLLAGSLYAQVYGLRQLSDEDWIGMTTEQRLKALNISNNHARNQTFVGDFGRNYDLYPRWGYDYLEMEDRYENYSFRNFENYNIVSDRRNRWYYNQFGDRLTKMTRNANIWRERINDDGTWDYDNPGGYINSHMRVDGIWVARESTDDWAVSVVGAEALRAKLTPLTLSVPNLRGMKIDFQSANWDASFVNSDVKGSGEGEEISFAGKTNKLMLRGGQIRRKFGALTLGANYANMHTIQPNRDGGHVLEGTVSDYAPVPIIYAVRIVDDSPHNGDGPIIHDVKLKINGRYRPEIVPQVFLDDLRREQVTAVTKDPQNPYWRLKSLYGYEPLFFDHTTMYERIPKYVDYLYMNDYLKGWNTTNVMKNFDVDKGKEFYKFIDTTKPCQVNGNEYAVYLFDLTSIQEQVRSVQAEITVANDYRIQVAEINQKKPKARQDPKGSTPENYYSAPF
ncbi:MAG: hypothetical protein GH151_00785 [Bacteroidetes bacterium]|nr:hypothetical protein [Bacteroidota bacterium]